MKYRVLVSLAAAALLLTALPVASYAQDTAVVKVGFPFIVDGKTMPAGEYELQLNSDESAFRLIAVPKDTGVFLGVITRLAAPEPPSNDTHVTFDHVGTKYYLSEVWLPGEDGYLVYAAREKHTHTIVKGHKKAK